MNVYGIGYRFWMFWLCSGYAYKTIRLNKLNLVRQGGNSCSQ